MASCDSSELDPLPKDYVPEIVLEESYKPSDDEEYMNEYHREYFRQTLCRWKYKLIRELENAIIYFSHDNNLESDINDQASREEGKIAYIRMEERYYKLIHKIDAALSRIKDRTYGYCADTGKEIGLKRLMARPVATLSLDAQEMHESFEKRHADDD